MERQIYRLTLDLRQTNSQAEIRATVGDSGRSIVASLTDGSTPFLLDGGSAVFKALKPDGNRLYNSCTVDGDTVTYNFTEETVSCEGTTVCEFDLYDGSNKWIASPRFALTVENAAYPDSLVVQSSSEYNKLRDALNSVENLDITAERINTGTTGVKVTVTDKDGVEKTTLVRDGEKGDTGVGIIGVGYVKTEGLTKTYRIYLSDDSTQDFTVTNGAKGDKGDTGDKGDAGPQGEKGDKGETGAKGMGILSITLLKTEGKEKTYRIFMADSTSTKIYDYVVTDGADGSPGETGVSVTGAAVTDTGHLNITLSDGTTIDAGVIPDCSALIKKEALNQLAEDATINVSGEDHNCYFGSDGVLIAANSTRTKVFEIEAGKQYTVKVTGDSVSRMINVGFSNTLLDVSGTVEGYTQFSGGTEYSFVNGQYKYLYIYYLGKVETTSGDALLSKTSNLVKSDDFAKVSKAVDDVVNDSLSPCITRTGYYVNSTAAYDSGSDYTAYTFRVNSGDKLRISGAYVNGNSKAVTLSSDGQLIGEFWTTTYSKAQTFDYTVGENVAFIRFTGFTNKGVSVEVMDSIAGLSDVATNKTKYNNSIGNFESAEVYLDYLDLSRGYLSFSDGVTVKEPTGAYYYTRYIAVHDNRTIVLNNAYGTEGVAFHCYDSEKNWKGYVDAGTFKYNRITNGQFKIPIGTAFIRFMVHVSNIKNYSMRYTEDFNKWYWADGIITDFMNATKWKVTKLFKKATQKPILTLIDDDTPTVASTKLYHDSCVANGVVGCYAVITQQLLSQSALATQLKAYEKDGFQNLFHCHSQIAAYDTSSESYNITTAEADFVQGAQEMQTFGFANWRYWCSPYGSCNEALAGLAKKWGMKCLVRSGLSDYETTIPKNLGKYQISRISLNQNDEALQTVKTALDNAATDNGWVLVTTHMGETGWDGETSQQRFTDMITYAKSKGFEIKTLGEAFEIRRPIYELYETF